MNMMNMLEDPLIQDLILWSWEQIKSKLKWKIRRQTCEPWFGMRFAYIENWSRQSLEQATFPGSKNFPSYRRYYLLSLNGNPVYWNGQTFIFTEIWFYWSNQKFWSLDYKNLSWVWDADRKNPSEGHSNNYNWATTWKNVSSGVSNQARHKLACAATEAS